LIEITYNGSHVLIMCAFGVWLHILDLVCVCVCVCALRRPENSVRRSAHTHTHTHTHTRSRICSQIPIAHISTCETLYVISIKYRPSLPDDGSYVIRNMLE